MRFLLHRNDKVKYNGTSNGQSYFLIVFLQHYLLLIFFKRYASNFQLSKYFRYNNTSNITKIKTRILKSKFKILSLINLKVECNSNTQKSSIFFSCWLYQFWFICFNCDASKKNILLMFVS